MASGSGHSFLGTSGWSYNHWRGSFYPDDVPQSRWFEYYSQHFHSVELNSSFYRIPAASTVVSWLRRSPPNFVFCVKVSRLITHTKQLTNCEGECNYFFTIFKPLRDKTGAFLVQVPPSVRFHPALLRDFLCQVPDDIPVVMEFRHGSWYNDTTYTILSENNALFCIHDMKLIETPRIVTGSAVYIRFHGCFGVSAGNYPQTILFDWATWIEEQRSIGKTVYAYFNNDINGYAVENCRQLQSMLTMEELRPKGD